MSTQAPENSEQQTAPFLKEQLKAFEKQKKKLSRQVGQAKKAGEDCRALIDEVRKLSGQIKSIKSSLKKNTENIPLHLSKNESCNPLAPQFTLQISQSKSPASIQLLDQTYLKEWEDYLHLHPQATIYHSLNTQKAIQSSFSHDTLNLIAFGPEGEICGVLPIINQKNHLFGNNWSSLPFFNYGGALADNYQIKEQLMAKAVDFVKKRGGDHIEYRDCHPVAGMPVKTDKVSMLLPLPPTSEQLWQQIGTKIRAQIKKARQHNLEIKTGREKLVDNFYTVFAQNMRDLGTPVYSKRLFINMLSQHSSARITIIYHSGKPVAAGFTLGWRNTLEIPWASTLRSANKLNANMLLYWAILSFAIESGYKIFDFGRSSKGAPTYKFKKQWGAQPHQLYWHYWLPEGREMPQVNPNNPKYKLLIGTWQRLPVWLTKIIGPPIAKYLP